LAKCNFILHQLKVRNSHKALMGKIVNLNNTTQCLLSFRPECTNLLYRQMPALGIGIIIIIVYFFEKIMDPTEQVGIVKKFKVS